MAQELLTNKLIACATFFPTTSMYHWQGAIEESSEWILLCKTTPQQVAAAREKITSLHSYEIPCILTFDAHSTPEYFVWACGAVGKNSDLRK